jgi:hypothetical protein
MIDHRLKPPIGENYLSHADFVLLNILRTETGRAFPIRIDQEI